MIEKTVFISYRRDPTGRVFGCLIKEALTHRGYDVFLDLDCLHAGQWSEQILSQVSRRAHFLLLLTPHALTRCAEEGDWVRREFLQAVASRRNIVPVREDSVDIAEMAQSCPESVKAVFDYQVATVRQEEFAHHIRMLTERFIHPGQASPVADTQVPLLIGPTRLPFTPGTLIDRHEAIERLNSTWENSSRRVIVLRAFGGVGKTSLVAEWIARLAADRRAPWRGAQRVFEWSFYTQGAPQGDDRNDSAASADYFITEALRFFGDPVLADSAASPRAKGHRLATLAGLTRTLLVLDGLEPLQYPPGHPGGRLGQIRDQALAALLGGIATQPSNGLCVVTTRQRLTDLDHYYGKTAEDWELDRLSDEAGAELLTHLGVRGTGDELRQTSSGVQGHALTLRLLGTWIAAATPDAHIRHFREIPFEEADRETEGRHAFKVMAAYEQWLQESGAAGRQQLAVLRLLALFDRPAEGKCLDELRRSPPITELTEEVVGMSPTQWNLTISRLKEAGLVIPGAGAIDCHPLLREYFAARMRAQSPGTWRAAHRRLCQYLSGIGEELPSTYAAMMPLMDAFVHGCLAGDHQKCFDELYRNRIERGHHHFLSNALGAHDTELFLLSFVFKKDWTDVVEGLNAASRVRAFRQLGLAFRARGDIEAAIPHLLIAETSYRALDDPDGYVNIARHVAQTLAAAGRLREARDYAEKSVARQDPRVSRFDRVAALAGLGHVAHQMGDLEEAGKCFEEAERLLNENSPEPRFLSSLQGFRYCEFLLSKGRPDKVYERAKSNPRRTDGAEFHAADGLAAIMRGKALQLGADASREPGAVAEEVIASINAGIAVLRNALQQEFYVFALLTRASSVAASDAGTARADLDEAWGIAERGPMRLHMADIHLYRARLFFREKPYPWKSPQDDLAAAEKLINDCGYHRRDEELADAQRAIVDAL